MLNVRRTSRSVLSIWNFHQPGSQSIQVNYNQRKTDFFSGFSWSAAVESCILSNVILRKSVLKRFSFTKLPLEGEKWERIFSRPLLELQGAPQAPICA